MPSKHCVNNLLKHNEVNAWIECTKHTTEKDKDITIDHLPMMVLLLKLIIHIIRCHYKQTLFLK